MEKADNNSLMDYNGSPVRMRRSNVTDDRATRSPRALTRSLTRDEAHHDSGRSGYPKQADSGFLTNSSESRDESPTRDMLRKHRSRSPRYPLTIDLYKSPTLDSIRSISLLHTFEDLEHEKYLLKDENRDMKDMVLQLQSTVRQLETARTRDSERFDLQEREIEALKTQLKSEKESRQTTMVAMEELQSEAARKSELLSLSNDELIDARERLRTLDKQLTDETTAKLHTERIGREYREKLDDLVSELDMERKVSRASLDSLRDTKDQLAKTRDELFMLHEALRTVKTSVTSSPPHQNLSSPRLTVVNKEASNHLRDIINAHNQLSQQLTDVQSLHAKATTDASDLSDQINNVARILRSETATEIVGNTLMNDRPLRDQISLLDGLRTSAPLDPLAKSIITLLDFEVKKRKVARDAIENSLKKFSWKGENLNNTQLIPLMNAILIAWSNTRSQIGQISRRLVSMRGQMNSIRKFTLDMQNAVQTMTVNFKKDTLLGSKYRLEGAVISFSDMARSRHDAIRRFLEAAHHLQMAGEINRVRSEEQAIRDRAVGVEKNVVKKHADRITELEEIIALKEGDLQKTQTELRDAESKLFRKIEEAKKSQKEHNSTLDTVNKKHTEEKQNLQSASSQIQHQLENDIARLKREIQQRIKSIALLDETVMAKDNKISQLQTSLREQEMKIDDLRRQLEIEKDPSRHQKLHAAIKGYEREAIDLRAKISERDTLITHLKRRVDEALNRGQKKVNETNERSRAELQAKDTKLAERERELEKVQEQLTRLTRVAAKGTNSRRSRETTLAADPDVKNVLNVRSVSGSDGITFPPIIPAAGIVGGDPNSNGQLTRRTTARSENRAQPTRRLVRTQSGMR
ncbi:LOW QUALITY PROTEIN: uncharacterized protein MG328-like [Paramacrobiotus metropolitanus]|uniref:LOW QUALITY PROTEIN: uncharacterized protein MG328-like n=1 Tax=Paramacrobiotus metropolitanus TaxID=2943436 RepID=UPI0024457995|nr:LOW QUALITY PROTEIN: uncharacterized protein MG328-like [Paramacrobiotus metropolitanus]